MYETIKKFLAEGGKCLIIENGEPLGVILTIEEYNKLQKKNEAAGQLNSDASAAIADIEGAPDTTLDDLGINEPTY